MSKPAIEARLLVENPAYESYRLGLLEAREKALKALLRRNMPYEVMTRLAGEVSALDHALGLPAELLGSDPDSRTPTP